MSCMGCITDSDNGTTHEVDCDWMIRHERKAARLGTEGVPAWWVIDGFRFEGVRIIER